MNTGQKWKFQLRDGAAPALSSGDFHAVLAPMISP
jgi:hypothetical protein